MLTTSYSSSESDAVASVLPSRKLKSELLLLLLLYSLKKCVMHNTKGKKAQGLRFFATILLVSYASKTGIF